MPKFLVITIFAILLLGIVVGGAFLIWQQFGGSGTEEGTPLQDIPGALFGTLPEAEQTESPTVDESIVDTEDTDQDGLINSEEQIWGTDINNPDTDGDGYLDGEEVRANHDPRKPAPDDLLEQTSPSPAPVNAESSGLAANTVEEFFTTDSDLDLTLGNSNLTDAYKEQYGETASPDTMTEFVNTQTINFLLPQPAPNLVAQGSENNAAIIRQYLTVANNPNILANDALYKQAQYDLQVKGNPGTMQSYAGLVRSYRAGLEQSTVPQEALPVHKLLLGYTELLPIVLDEITLWNQDPVKSMVASRQLEILDRKYYPIIYQELQRLEALQ